MVYLYAVTEPLGDGPDGTGVEEAPLRVVTSGELAAVVSDRGDAPLAVSEDALWAHERVVEELMADRAVLPMRFGSSLRDDRAVQGMLAARCEELRAGLRRVRGAVELGVRAAWDPKAAAGNGNRDVGAGAEYLLGQSRSRQRARSLAERLDRSVAGLCRERVQRLLTSPSLPVSAAYLVDRAGVGAFREGIGALDAEIADAQIVCTGPWPPYSFTGAESP
jgi:hypothetical protein